MAEIDTLLITGAVDLLSSLFRIVFFVAALLFLSWQLALLAFVVTPLFWLASHLFSDRIKRIAREQRRRHQRYRRGESGHRAVGPGLQP